MHMRLQLAYAYWKTLISQAAGDPVSIQSGRAPCMVFCQCARWRHAKIESRRVGRRVTGQSQRSHSKRTSADHDDDDSSGGDRDVWKKGLITGSAAAWGSRPRTGSTNRFFCGAAWNTSAGPWPARLAAGRDAVAGRQRRKAAARPSTDSRHTSRRLGAAAAMDFARRLRRPLSAPGSRTLSLSLSRTPLFPTLCVRCSSLRARSHAPPVFCPRAVHRGRKNRGRHRSTSDRAAVSQPRGCEKGLREIADAATVAFVESALCSLLAQICCVGAELIAQPTKPLVGTAFFLVSRCQFSFEYFIDRLNV